MSDSKLLPDLKGSAVYLCEAANVLFYSLVTAGRERDRSTGTPSAAAMTNRGAQRGRDPPRTRPAAGKDVKVKKEKKNRTEEKNQRCAASWSLICLVKRQSGSSKRRSLRNKDGPDNVDKHTGSGCSQ